MSQTDFAFVCVDSRTLAIEKELTYYVPDKLREKVRLGTAVLVPVHRLAVAGYVVGFAEQPPVEEAEIKPVLKVLFDEPLFDEELLRLARWVAGYYHCGLAEALRVVVPPGWQQQVRRWVQISDEEAAKKWLAEKAVKAKKQAQLLQALLDAKGAVSLKDLQAKFGQKVVSGAIRALLQAGIIKEVSEAQAKAPKPIRRQAVKLGNWEIGKLGDLAERQRALLEVVRRAGGGPVLVADLEQQGFSRHTVGTLIKQGLLELTEVILPREGEVGATGFEPQPFELTEEQKKAVEVITQSLDAGKFKVILIHGVTASGKTEVYLRAIEHAFKAGKQAILLVPEIALTAQAARAFRERFGERVAILHSGMGGGARFEQWKRIRDDEADVVVGPRSAIFAPCNRLGLLIVDEEQDESYKQEHTPRYHARDVGLVRARWANATVVLGSATPSIESYYKAMVGRYTLVQLTKRIDERPLPIVHLIDLRSATHTQSPFLSDPLLSVLRQRLSSGEQAILFLNRRGFAAFQICPQCGWVERCVNCDVALTYHLRERVLLCHHCNFSLTPPTQCSRCGSLVMTFRGAGTERIESEVARLIANSKPLRMDTDTTRRRGSHARILTQFRQHQANVLVGTQMVTKGLDFPEVTLVGVLHADASLNFPDFRAAERTFQLLTQVSGRAGRGERAGEVHVQTFRPDHYAVQAAVKQDFIKFFKQEIQRRRQPPYPPFSYLINVIASDPDANVARETILKVADIVRKAIIKEGATAQVVGPAPCLISRLRGQYRWHFLLRGKSRRELNQVMAKALETMDRDLKRRVTVDVDPMTLD